MSDYTYLLFDISDTSFCSHIYDTYPQPQILWKLCPLPHKLLPCVISMLFRKMCYQEILRMISSRGCTVIGTTSAPPFWLVLLSNIHPSPELRTYMYIDTGSNIPTNPSDACNDLENNRFLRHGEWLR